MENTIQIRTSSLLSVSIEVEPNRVVQTSPDTLPLVLNMFISMYPIARAPTLSIAITASPFMELFCPVFRRKIAVIIVTGRMIIILSVSPMTLATAIAPKATCESPSPM